MKNVKGEVAQKLLTVSENVSDAYPADWSKDHVIQYMEEDNKVHTRTDNTEQLAYIRYRIDIWHNKSTSEIAMQVDEAISSLGLVRTMCQDVADHTMKHKVMRYEGIIDMESGIVYWE